MSDLRADLDVMLQRIHEQPYYQPERPLLSPRCGLAGHISHGGCRSSMCECCCHREAS